MVRGRDTVPWWRRMEGVMSQDATTHTGRWLQEMETLARRQQALERRVELIEARVAAIRSDVDHEDNGC